MSASLSLERAAHGFAAAGSAPRLEVLLALVRAGAPGLSVGAIQKRVGIPGSTLAHHLRFLAAAGLIVQERQGREVLNRADFGHIRKLGAFLLSECCSQQGREDGVGTAALLETAQ